LGGCLDRGARGPPAGAVLDAGLVVEHRRGSPADAVAHVVRRRQPHPDEERGLHRGADGGEGSLVLVAGRDPQRAHRLEHVVDLGERRVEPPVQVGPIAGRARPDEVTDHGRHDGHAVSMKVIASSVQR
jgi:hypothetical protein